MPKGQGHNSKAYAWRMREYNACSNLKKPRPNFFLQLKALILSINAVQQNYNNLNFISQALFTSTNMPRGDASYMIQFCSTKKLGCLY
jgi:hypothetical protein